MLMSGTEEGKKKLVMKGKVEVRAYGKPRIALVLIFVTEEGKKKYLEGLVKKGKLATRGLSAHLHY